MIVSGISRMGSRIEFETVWQDEKYLVVFHALDDGWAVVKLRPDGERELMSSEAAAEVLALFPKEAALSMAEDRNRA